ncbi:Ribonuclease P protein subunit p30, partial [Ophiophagus hannah]
MAAFADLSILYLPEKEALQKLVEAAAHLGYSSVAINYVVNYKENKKRATSTNIKYYDIFAVFPKNVKLFHVACTTLDVDLVCVEVTEKLPFFIKRPSVNAAIERGVYFELLYVPAIKDSTMRRYTISNAYNLLQICRGKNIVLSSGAEKPIQLRGPYDVANMLRI